MWKYWQNEFGVLTGGHYPRKSSSTLSVPENHQHSGRTHNGSLRLRSTSAQARTNTVLNTFGDSGKWTIAIRYRLNNFPNQIGALLRIADTVGNINRISINTPGSASLEAQILIYGADGSTLNQYDWDLTGEFYTPATASRLEWSQLVITYDSSQAAADEATFYMNGLEITPTSTTIGGSTNQTNTDRYVQLGQTAFGANANIHDLAIWEGVVLTADEVKAIHNHGLRGFDLQSNRDGYVSSDSLVNWFRMAFNGATVLAFTDSIVGGSLDLLDNATNLNINTAGSPNSPTGTYVSFNGSDERFEANNDGAGRLLGIEDEFTVAAWMKAALPASNRTFLDINDVDSSGRNRIRLRRTTSGFSGTYNDGTNSGTAIFSASLDSWRFVVLTKPAGEGATLYVDGDAGTTGSSTPVLTDTARAVAIGGEVGGGNFFVGDIATVAVWNTSMTAEDVRVLHNEGCIDLDLRRSFKGYRHASSLLHWWHCGQPAQTTETGGDRITDRGHALSLVDMSEDETGLARSNVHNDCVVAGSRGKAGTFLRLDGSTEALTTNGDVFTGIANDWGLNFSLRPQDISSIGTAPIIEFKQSGTDVSRIRIRLLGTLSSDPLDIAIWNSSGSAIKVYRWRDVFTNNEWTNFHLTWNGSNLRLWIDGELTAPSTTPLDGSGTMTDAARQVNIGSVVAGWGGDISHLAVWSQSDDPVVRQSIRQIIYKTPKLDYLQNVNSYLSSSALEQWWVMMGQSAIGDNHIPGAADLNQNIGSITRGDNSGCEGF